MELRLQQNQITIVQEDKEGVRVIKCLMPLILLVKGETLASVSLDPMKRFVIDADQSTIATITD